jgi:hypothetical protein
MIVMVIVPMADNCVRELGNISQGVPVALSLDEYTHTCMNIIVTSQPVNSLSGFEVRSITPEPRRSSASGPFQLNGAPQILQESTISIAMDTPLLGFTKSCGGRPIRGY